MASAAVTCTQDAVIHITAQAAGDQRRQVLIRHQLGEQILVLLHAVDKNALDSRVKGQTEVVQRVRTSSSWQRLIAVLGWLVGAAQQFVYASDEADLVPEPLDAHVVPQRASRHSAVQRRVCMVPDRDERGASSTPPAGGGHG